jgi:hypothetical protein
VTAPRSPHAQARFTKQPTEMFSRLPATRGSTCDHMHAPGRQATSLTASHKALQLNGERKLCKTILASRNVTLRDKSAELPYE